MVRFGLILSILIALSACTTISDYELSKSTSGASLLSESQTSYSNSIVEREPCFPALAALDRLALQHSGTLLGNRIGAMPWLRHNRLITHNIAIQRNHQTINKLLKQMSDLAKRGLRFEIAATPKDQLRHWQQRYQIATSTDEFIHQCTTQLIRLQRKTPPKTLASLKAIPPDNDYSRLARVAGLYPLASIPFRLGVVKEQRQLAKEWGQVRGKDWYQYQPAVRANAKSETVSKSSALLERHAPVWLVDSATQANLPGVPFWQGEKLSVNTQRPTTYAFLSEARWNQQPVTQLNYVIWFTERPPLKRLDWVAGQHDAVVFRVNLNQQNEVLAYDSIHLCGCWYRLFLPEGRPFRSNNSYWREPVLMQRVRLPTKSNSSMAIYLQADTHQIQHIQPVADIAKTTQVVTVKSYQLAPFSQLLKLSTGSGIRPVFNRQGYVAGSERPERWLFWPMGVKNPGALRRFGDHAISFVGRRYFDDPYLLEKVSGFKSDSN